MIRRLICLFSIAVIPFLAVRMPAQNAPGGDRKDQVYTVVIKKKPGTPPSEGADQPPLQPSGSSTPEATPNPGAGSSGVPRGKTPRTTHNAGSSPAHGSRASESNASERPPNDASGATTLVTDRVVQRTLGSERYQQVIRQLESAGPGGDGDNGRGGPASNIWFDGSALRAGNDDGLRPSGTPIFRLGGEQGSSPQPPAPVTNGSAPPVTREYSSQTIRIYGTIPGGVVLEGQAAGLGEVHDLQYDGRFNAFIFDGQYAYFMRVPPSAVAVLCRAIAQDKEERIGVSLGRTQLVYGEGLPEDSNVIWDLKLADHFLGSIVFGWKDDWTAGYQFARGFTPKADPDEKRDFAVFFVFTGFEFKIRQDELLAAKEDFFARVFPLSETRAADGGLLPDDKAISAGQTSGQYQINAEHVAKNIRYYRKEKIIDRAFAYGEVAAVLRELKRQNFDLEDLAKHVPGA
jgi:hypothetical protein